VSRSPRMPRSPVPPPSAGAAAQSAAGRALSDASQQGTAGAPPSVRAQLLATEHWSLLATRSTTQSEVLSRITTFLMLVSASIVSLALIGQATRFDRRFITFALVLLGMVLMIGALTQMRLGNAAIEDLAHVIGMNRLRAAYVELDPGIERYLVTSAHDDDPGIWQTYNHLMGPNPIWQPFASTAAFITLVNSGLTGVFAALVAVALDAPGPLVGAVAAACGLAFLGVSVILAVRQAQRLTRGYVSMFPAPDTTDTGGGDSQAVAQEAQA
jgi:FtsH-binding integral membrane protein